LPILHFLCASTKKINSLAKSPVDDNMTNNLNNLNVNFRTF
jgi:hypothetical protein